MQIHVWSDFACPWCALGLERLHLALNQFDHEDVTVVHRSFELDPSAPARRGLTMEEMLTRKYGMNPQQIRAGHERLTAMGAEVGLEFRFDRIQLGSTFDAHRLAQAAHGTPSEAAIVQGLFSAYFSDGKLLSDPDVLSGVAAAAGLDPGIVGRVLGDAASEDAYAIAVRADETAAHELGITGVPHFVIDNKWAVSGAQDVETLVLTLKRATAT